MTKIAWEEFKNSLEVGALIKGTITKHEPYGVFVSIGYEYDGLIQVTDFKDDGIMTPEEYPIIGDQILAKILGFKDQGRQVWLGVKPSQLKSMK